MKQPLVSVIVPTKNSAIFLEACLKSIRNQNYEEIELIVVDNQSTDTTVIIAKKYTDKVFTLGPERSVQRNYGANMSNGEFLLFIDSDMELTAKVVESCVTLATQDTKIKALIIPEESFGEGFWAQCKKLERSFYIGVDWMEAARFFEVKIFRQVGGYDESMISGEDWDLSQRVNKIEKVKRIDNYILHNEGKVSLLNIIQKKFYYAQKFKNYLDKNKSKDKTMQQVSVIRRFKLYLSNPSKLWERPLVGAGVLYMKLCEFFYGGLGLYVAKIRSVH